MTGSNSLSPLLDTVIQLSEKALVALKILLCVNLEIYYIVVWAAYCSYVKIFFISVKIYVR